MSNRRVPITRILFPVDFSERCTEMLPYVKAIAASYKAQLLLLHVINPIYVIPETGIGPPTALSVPEWLRCQQSEQLEEFGKAELAGLSVRRLVREGEPGSQIAEIAVEEKAQLVAIPTHGYGVFRRLLIGSVTAKVLHDVECPVLTSAHCRESIMCGAKISNVVCAIDLGPNSCDVLSWATRIAADFNACLSVIHVLPRLDPSLKVVFSSDVAERLTDSIREEISRLESAAGTRKVTVCIEEGDVAPKVCSYAKSIGADLVVVGRGQKGLEIGRLRTNTFAIVRQSSCPVLSV